MTDNMQTVLMSIVSLCLMMAPGFFLSKTKRLDDAFFSGLSKLLLELTMPCLIIASLQRPFSSGLLKEAGLCALIFGVSAFAAYFLGKLLNSALKVKAPADSVFLYGMVFPNVSYMGFPLIESAYGQEGLFYAIIVSAAFNIFAFSFGVAILEGKSFRPKPREFLKPAFVASIAGLLLFAFSIEIPEPFIGAMRTVGGATTPLSMLIIGATLAKAKPRDVFLDKKLYVFSAVKLLLIPAVFWLAMRLLFGGGMMVSALTLLIGMPSAALTAIQAAHYKKDAVLASRLIFVTTALSALSLPLLTILDGVTF